MPSPRLGEAEFKRRFRSQFQDPAFETLNSELSRITEAAWDAYANSRKSPRTLKAGPEFADPALCIFVRRDQRLSSIATSGLDRYIGYWKPYATSHEELDADRAIQEEVRNAARTLLDGVRMKRAGQFVAAGQELTQPRQK